MIDERTPDWDQIESSMAAELAVIHPLVQSGHARVERGRSVGVHDVDAVVARAPPMVITATHDESNVCDIAAGLRIASQEHVSGPWGVLISFAWVGSGEPPSMLVDELSASARESWVMGPYPAEHLRDALWMTELIRKVVFTTWLSRQARIAAEYEFAITYGATLAEATDQYFARWAAKDTEVLSVDVECLAATAHFRAMEKAAIDGDAEAAAEHGEVAQRYFYMRHMAGEQYEPLRFADALRHCAPEWERIRAAKENHSWRLSAIASEGFAEWTSFSVPRLLERGLIRTKLPPEMADWAAYMRNQRRAVGRLSRTNPYRLGLERIEAIAARVETAFAWLLPVVIRWPFERLLEWTPLQSVVSMTRDSPWVPDARLRKLAVAPPPEKPTSLGAVLDWINEQLDRELPALTHKVLDEAPNPLTSMVRRWDGFV